MYYIVILSYFTSTYAENNNIAIGFILLFDYV